MRLAADLAALVAGLLAGTMTEDAARERLRALVADGPQLRLVGAPPKEDLREVALRLFGYWRTQTNHPSARPDPTRIAKAQARLRDGFSEQELRWAIDGMAGSDFHGGANDAGKRYDDMELCFRNVRNVERFIEAARGKGGATVRDQRDEERAKLRAQAQRALREGRTDDHDRILRQLRSS